MRLLCFLLALSVLQPLAARILPPDSLASEPELARFYEGCLKIIEGDTATDSLEANKAFAQAMDRLNTRSTGSHQGLNLGRMKAEIANPENLMQETTIPFAYDYTYARSRYRGIDYAPRGLSRGMGRGCRVLDLVLAPGARVECSEEVSGDCFIVALAQPGGALSLEVTRADGQSVPTESFADGMMAYGHWDNGGRSAVVYTVGNTTDKPLLITLFAN